jgi:integrase
MANKCRGLKHIKDDIWLIDCQVNRRRVQERIRANSLKDAKIIRQERIVELRKQSPFSQTERERFNADINEAWNKLESDLRSDGLCKKNLLRNRVTFRRLFEDFRKAKYPHIKSISQISLTYLQEYKAYFVNELGHNPRGGLRAELICIKSMLRRLRRLGFCGKEIIEALSEFPRPTGEKKDYPDIPGGKIREMLNYIKNDRPDFYGIIYYISRLGRRIGETLSIERKDVVWNGLRPVKINIRPEITKMKESAPIDRIDDALAEVIVSTYRRGSKHKTIYLFCNIRGKKCSQGTLQKYLRRVSKQIIGVEITPHYFRHRFLTECAKANLSMVDVMHVAGIRDTDVMKTYYQHSTSSGLDLVLEATRV